LVTYNKLLDQTLASQCNNVQGSAQIPDDPVRRVDSIKSLLPKISIEIPLIS